MHDMADAPFTDPAVEAMRLEAELGARRAFQEAKSRHAAAITQADAAAADHWCAVGLLVVDAWKACPPRPHA